MSMVDDTLHQLRQDIDATVVALKAQLGSLRTGRASLSILDNIRVNYYGTPTPLNQCANLTVADARLLTVKPWDKGLISEIEKAILASNIGIMPQSDGEMIRLPVPQLTEERRRDLVKQSKQRGEDAKIGLRNHRRDANELLKECEKDKQISQDELKRALEKVQEQVDAGAKRIDETLAVKEKEIMEI
jgi:ribosome recycling factor